MIMLGIAVTKSRAKLALTKDGIIPGNRVDKGLGPIPEDHIDTDTVHALGGRTDEVILIPRNRDDEDTVHVRTDMLVRVQTPSRMKGLTMRLWM